MARKIILLGVVDIFSCRGKNKNYAVLTPKVGILPISRRNGVDSYEETNLCNLVNNYCIESNIKIRK